MKIVNNKKGVINDPLGQHTVRLPMKICSPNFELVDRKTDGQMSVNTFSDCGSAEWINFSGF